MNTYDVIVVGAGINGCCLAYKLHNLGQKVLVLEQEEVASGGSGAAGAFINPKISKSGELKDLIEKSYLYSMDFYKTNFLPFTNLAPLLHISKYEDENDKVEVFKEKTELKTSKTPDEIKELLTEYVKPFESVYLEDNAIVEAKDICNEMLIDIEYKKIKVTTPQYKDGLWQIEGFKAKKLVLATGAYDEVVSEPYLKLRRIFGQRCDIESSTFMEATIHHEVSVSATKKNGRISLGASHYLNQDDLPLKEQGALDMIELALKSVKLKDIKIHSSYCGMRSGSNDYLPILGRLVSAKKSLELDASALKGNKQAELNYIPELYMINGVGGYGFVLAPYLSELLCKALVNDSEIPEFLEPKRFYYRWAKKDAKMLKTSTINIQKESKK